MDKLTIADCERILLRSKTHSPDMVEPLAKQLADVLKKNAVLTEKWDRYFTFTLDEMGCIHTNCPDHQHQYALPCVPCECGGGLEGDGHDNCYTEQNRTKTSES